MSRLVLSYRDYSSEMSTIEMLIAEPSAGGADFDAVLADAAELVAAIDDITIATLGKEGLVINESAVKANGAAGSKRELGLRVFWYEDTEPTVGHFTIPAPNPTGAWLVEGTDQVDLSDTDIAAFVTAVEANVYSQFGNLVTVQKIVEVGRRN